MRNVIKVEGFEVPVGKHLGKRIYLASDHRGYKYKDGMIKALTKKYLFASPPITDLGTFSPERTDYPIISDELGKHVSSVPDQNVGIGICGSGIGILIPASKHPGVYPARCLSPREAETSRRHNNTNLLGIGADYVDFDTALNTVIAWLETPFYSDPKTEEAYLQRFIQTLQLEAQALGKA